MTQIVYGVGACYVILNCQKIRLICCTVLKPLQEMCRMDTAWLRSILHLDLVRNVYQLLISLSHTSLSLSLSLLIFLLPLMPSPFSSPLSLSPILLLHLCLFFSLTHFCFGLVEKDNFNREGWKCFSDLYCTYHVLDSQNWGNNEGVFVSK